MFERQARQKGERDGRADAELLRPRRPRPSLLLALLSNGYRDAYLVAYKNAYDRMERRFESQRSNELKQSARLIDGARLPANHSFDRGWRDGFDGKDTPPERLSYDDLRAYERGHRLGAQQRDYERSNQLRQSARHQNRARSQGQSR